MDCYKVKMLFKLLIAIEDDKRVYYERRTEQQRLRSRTRACGRN